MFDAVGAATERYCTARKVYSACESHLVPGGLTGDVSELISCPADRRVTLVSSSRTGGLTGDVSEHSRAGYTATMLVSSQGLVTQL